MEEIFKNNTAINELTEKIIGCAYEVSNTLGSGFPESGYEKALQHQIIKIKLKAERQFQMKVHYDGVLVGEFFADQLVEDEILIEIKAVRELDDLHVAQAMNYLKASALPLCLLINFGRPKIEVRRFVPYDAWRKSKHHVFSRNSPRKIS